MVELVPWSQLPFEARAQASALQVTEQQVEYAGTTEAALTQYEAASREEVECLVILRESAVVGLLLLKRGAKAPKWAPPSSVVMSALRVAPEAQGRGIGTAALSALPQWVRSRWPEARAVSLSVDEENAAAIRAYVKAGWVDHGVRVEGRIGWVRYMSYPLPHGPNPSIERTPYGGLRPPPGAAHVERWAPAVER
jgi:diamine N-acetyltransferase